MASLYPALFVQAPWCFVGFAAFMGLIVGSFLNVVILRVPKGQSIISPASHCVCGKALSAVDNLPIVGWLALRGRARCCGAAISIRYLLTEALTGLCFGLCAFQRDFPHVLVGMLFCSTLIAACLIDWDTFLLLDRFTIPLAFLGLIFSAIFPTLQGYVIPWSHLVALLAFEKALLGALVGTAVIYWLGTFYTLLTGTGCIGEGDLQLLAAIGAFTGIPGALFTIIGGSAIGCLYFFACEVWKVAVRSPCPFACTAQFPKEMGETPPTGIPFGPFLGSAGILYFFTGPRLLLAIHSILIPH